jgi:drug/metabolite transporter (DMT)-like permease
MKDAKWIVILLFVTLVWGATFPLVKDTLKVFDAFAMMGMRFLIAAASVWLYLKFAGGKLEREEWRHGAVLGFLLFVGYGMQTYGLNYTEATKSAFITGLYVIGVPVLSALLLSRRSERKIWIAAALAAIGLWLLSGAGSNWNLGDGVTLITAVAFSLHIIYTGMIAKRCGPVGLSVAQLLVCGVLSLVPMVALGETPAEFPLGALGAVVFLGVVANGFAMWAQSAAQRVMDASRVALVFIGEPVFAAVISVMLFGEILREMQIVGAGLILAGMVVAEWEKVKL